MLFQRLGPDLHELGLKAVDGGPDLEGFVLRHCGARGEPGEGGGGK